MELILKNEKTEKKLCDLVQIKIFIWPKIKMKF